MAAAVQFPATATISSLVFQKTPNKPRNTHFPLVCSPKTPIKLSNSIKTFSSSPSNSIRRDDNDHPPDALSISLPSFHPLKPYLISEWQPILKGWIFSALSVYCLSKLVPTVGKFSAIFYTFDSNRWIVEGLKLSALVLVRSAANYWQQAFLWEAALNSACRIRVYVFERVLKRDLWFFEGEVSTGDVAYRITAEAADVADTVYALLTTIVPNFLQLFAVATQMLVTSPVLSMISALVIPCISLVIALLGERLRTISRKAHLSVARLSAYLNEVLPSMLVIKANNATLCESVRFQRLAQDDLTELLKKKKMKALIPQITQAICIGSLLMFSTGSLVISGGSFDGSSMVSFITSLVLLIEPIQGIGKAYNELKQGEPALERLFDLTRFNSKVIDKPDAVDLDSITGDVKFCDITFRYGDDMPLVLNGLNLHVKAGEVIAIVGPSGGGKSTLTKLLLRLYDPQGCILLDNHDIQDIRLESLRRHIALVSQDITLFSGTVAENIGYRDLMSKIDMAQVEHAAKIANADEFIRTLSEGYETNIGQRGSLLSGGQKQRLAIARALYQNSSILILDEATSALDSRSELLVRQAVERLMDNHTVLVIAHSLETVRMADRVLLLDGGKLQEVTLSSVLSKSEEHGSLVSSGHII
ncbi:ABC transporter B family member 29, chloroplastic isoform X2 [Magnolia sinica]|uniref:ABC transporter B family member 29, chloroplastic isoform X2 n=1 Tax=Magnolia sinica TaxID=86752 RepID=UPI00265A651C|nr:ABC transporter B family member 29, chloroplastic isoform X2 [Magnolia sinica]